MPSGEEMRKEYDFSRGVRGKHAGRFAAGTIVVVLDPDVAELFGSSDEVNRTLRSLANLARRHVGRKRPSAKPTATRAAKKRGRSG